MKKAIIFDMDGLMIDSERVTYEEYCRKLEQLEYHFDENMYRRCLGKNKQSVYSRGHGPFFGAKSSFRWGFFLQKNQRVV